MLEYCINTPDQRYPVHCPLPQAHHLSTDEIGRQYPDQKDQDNEGYYTHSGYIELTNPSEKVAEKSVQEAQERR